ncbi:uncharacterized protein LOC131681221 [Topomyia yanbarensis]|uniref:uncharacterized protein LOC131681221 n=1 Tax=Topomyia yanbarensis TaxID=2498891 RepID=UPI00273B8244|nr:uncharacterized protein LOC131681221 [Topomyia yanbarensis]
MVGSKRKPGSEKCSEETINKCISSIRKGAMTLYKACKMYGSPMSTIRYRISGRKWFGAFLRRNPGLSLRKPEAVTTASSRVSKEDIRGWFTMTKDWLLENGFFDIMEDPTRIYNGDETSFYLHPKTKEVIARTGSRNVYEVQQAPGKQNVTVMFSFSAAGAVVTPQVILPGKRRRKEVAEGFPSEWAIGLSDCGWMDVDNYRFYTKKVFHPFLVQQAVKFPVVFFVDGHASHKAMEVKSWIGKMDEVEQ